MGEAGGDRGRGAHRRHPDQAAAVAEQLSALPEWLSQAIRQGLEGIDFLLHDFSTELDRLCFIQVNHPFSLAQSRVSRGLTLALVR
jgi:hypothetical protein